MIKKLIKKPVQSTNVSLYLRLFEIEEKMSSGKSGNYKGRDNLQYETPNT